MASFGHFIKKERAKREWTQTEFGAKIGNNSSAISRMENGSQRFSVSKLKKLSEILNIDFQAIKDLFYADKFAQEAYKNNCSDKVFMVAEDTVKYIQDKNSKQAKLKL